MPPVLEALLGKLADRGHSARLRQVFLAASNAVHRLFDLDLVKYESTSMEGAPDLALWEEMAPVIRDTVVDVNRLLMVIREQFPVHPPGGLADTLFRAVEEAGPAVEQSVSARQLANTERIFQESSGRLAEEISRLGERMRSPSVVADRWNLLTDLQAFRARFREEISEMVYASASLYAEVHRKDVVPSFRFELESALLVRAAVAELEGVLRARLAQVQGAEPEDVQWHAHQLEKELDAFGVTSAYRALRAPDKREVIERRHQLRQLGARPALSRRELLATLEPLAAFVSELRSVNQREMILQHDRELCANCAVKLEKAQQLMRSDRIGSAVLLGEALAAARALYGRDGGLDAFLRPLEETPVTSLAGPQLPDSLEQFTQLLGGLQLY